MTHAMVITAVHLNNEGYPVRYKVENSWGPDRGDKVRCYSRSAMFASPNVCSVQGYFVMTDKWFEQ